jgi:hypothetical protein
LAIDDKGRRAEHADRFRLFGRGLVTLADLIALGRFDDAGRALTDLSQVVGKTGLRTRFAAGVAPMPIGGASVVRAPALALADDCDAIGEMEFGERIRRRQSRLEAARSRSPLDVASHVRQLDELAHEGNVFLFARTENGQRNAPRSHLRPRGVS